jgi:hypothetical protein
VYSGVTGTTVVTVPMPAPDLSSTSDLATPPDLATPADLATPSD